MLDLTCRIILVCKLSRIGPKTVGPVSCRVGVGDVNFPRTRLLWGGCPPLGWDGWLTFIGVEYQLGYRPVFSKRNNEISMLVKTPMYQTRNGYLRSEIKGRQLFLFSEVVQRYSGDEKVMCWLNSFSQFRRTIRDWSHSCISPLTGIAPTQTFINFFFQ